MSVLGSQSSNCSKFEFCGSIPMYLLCLHIRNFLTGFQNILVTLMLSIFNIICLCFVVAVYSILTTSF